MASASSLDGWPAPGHAGAPGSWPLADILRAVGRELADLGRLACRLQTVLSPLSPVGPASGRDPGTVEGLQSLDLLAQRLHGTADFLGALAPNLPAEWVAEAGAAARVLTLSDLAHRLGRPGLDRASDAGGLAGDLELFEADGDG